MHVKTFKFFSYLSEITLKQTVNWLWGFIDNLYKILRWAPFTALMALVYAQTKIAFFKFATLFIVFLIAVWVCLKLIYVFHSMLKDARKDGKFIRIFEYFFAIVFGILFCMLFLNVWINVVDTLAGLKL